MSDVNTDGGTYVGGNVSTQGGKFVGRDEITNIHYGHPASAGPLFVGVPVIPNNFVGRDALLEDIVQRLITGENRALSSEGMPGVGKTTLAVAVAHHQAIRQYFTDGVLWAGLGQEPDVMNTLAQWAQWLDVDVSALANEAERTEAVKDVIGQRHLLIVIDDAWQLEPAQHLRVGGPNCRHLLTTRDKAIARAFAGSTQVTRVPVLEENPAYELLQKLAPEACTADPQVSRDLVHVVGGLPLALELLGGYLATPEHSEFQELIKGAFDELSDPQRRLQLAGQRLGAHHNVQMTLHEIITLSLSNLQESVVHAFYAMGAFAAKPEVYSLAAARAVTNTDTKTLALLVSRNLIAKEHESLSLHQVLADVARTRVDQDAITRHRDFYVALAQDAWPDWQRIDGVYGQIKHAWQGAPNDAGLVQFLAAIQQYQYRRGLWRDFVSWSNRSLPIFEEIGDRAGLATTLTNIGAVYKALGQPNQALEYYQRSLPIFEEIGGRAGLAATLNNIGAVYNTLGQPNQALEYYQRSLPIREEVGDRTGLAVTLTNIGAVYNNLGQLNKALEYFQRSLPIREEVGDRTGLATTLTNIGAVYKALGQPNQALEYYQRSLPIFEEIGDRIELAGTLNNISAAYNALGQPNQALEYYQRSLPIIEELGDHAWESVTRYKLAEAYRDLDQLAEAIAQLKRVVELDHQIQHPDLENHQARLAYLEVKLAAQSSVSPTPPSRPSPTPTPTPKPPPQPPSPRQDAEPLFMTIAPGVKMEFVRVPAGEFLMGSLDSDKGADDGERPWHKVTLVEYMIGKYDVTNAQYAVFCKAMNHKWTMPRGKENHPVVHVRWDDAMAFCKWACQVTGRGVHLPTEAQWEKAARGTDWRLFPWGNEEPDASKLNYNNPLPVGGTTPVGKYSPAGDSPYGVADMAGNVWQWTSSLHKPYPYNATDGREDQSSRNQRVIRGGGYVSGRRDVRCANRNWWNLDFNFDGLGFRVVASPL